jgi:aryl-alcohol dehydrogenase-like predicted oxidoreductase
LKHRRLGHSGLMVSELCLGAMTFGREIDEGGARAMIDYFLDAGGNFIDTADVYSRGVSEEITGRALKGRRHEVVLATKVRFPMGDGPNDVGASRRHIIDGCNASLRRLGCDFIDLYQIHCWDAATPLEETMSALSDLVRQGKVRYLGASNFTGWQIVESSCVAQAHDFVGFVSLQPQYSMVERHIEWEVVPACLEAGLGLIPWGPLGQGWLTGKYRKGEPPPEGSRITTAGEDLEEAWHKRATERNWAIVGEVGAVAEETGKSYAQVALNWLLSRPAVTSPIIGATKLAQLEDNLAAVGWKLEPEQVERLDKVSALPDVYPYHFIERSQRSWAP